jgi:4-alpha-glucanotransferase
MAYASIADVAILPLQDVLEMDERARMNTPATTDGNWQWRFDASAINEGIEQTLASWVSTFNRG